MPYGEVEQALADLRLVQVARAELDGRQERLVQTLVAHGVSWGHVGKALGVTRQAAHKRYTVR